VIPAQKRKVISLGPEVTSPLGDTECVEGEFYGAGCITQLAAGGRVLRRRLFFAIYAGGGTKVIVEAVVSLTMITTYSIGLWVACALRTSPTGPNLVEHLELGCGLAPNW